MAAALLLASALAACVRAPVTMPPGSVVDAPRFSLRAGWPDYAATIRYIDDHVHYADIDTRFMIGPRGDMCYVDQPGRAWCIPPRAVAQVRMDEYVNLHCSKWFPFCAYMISKGAPAGEVANLVQVRERFEDRAKLVAALEHLLYLMGGPDPRPDPFADRAALPGG